MGNWMINKLQWWSVHIELPEGNQWICWGQKKSAKLYIFQSNPCARVWSLWECDHCEIPCALTSFLWNKGHADLLICQQPMVGDMMHICTKSQTSVTNQLHLHQTRLSISIRRNMKKQNPSLQFSNTLLNGTMITYLCHRHKPVCLIPTYSHHICWSESC